MFDCMDNKNVSEDTQEMENGNGLRYPGNALTHCRLNELSHTYIGRF